MLRSGFTKPHQKLQLQRPQKEGLILVSKLSKKVGWFGIIASFLGLIAAWIGWIDPSLQYVGFALFIPMILWEFAFGIWLIRKSD
jgi:hypothetical protein